MAIRLYTSHLAVHTQTQTESKAFKEHKVSTVGCYEEKSEVDPGFPRWRGGEQTCQCNSKRNRASTYYWGKFPIKLHKNEDIRAREGQNFYYADPPLERDVRFPCVCSLNCR